MSRVAAPGALFALLCLVWGSNWLVLKLALAEAPAFGFASARSLLAGAIMVALAGPARVLALLRASPGRVIVTALATNTLTYAGLYWGTARIPTGLAAIVNNALMPIGLMGFAVALGEEAFSRRRLAGLAVGACGLALLFARRGAGGIDAAAIAGIAAVAAGTLAYCLGSVQSRPLLAHASPMALGGAQMLVGGLALLPLAAWLEGPTAIVAPLAQPLPLAGLAWLAVLGGVAGFTIYLRLIRDWGPTRAGMYAFVAPLVATALGAAVLGERLGRVEAAGGALMLAAAALVIAGPAPAPRAPGDVASP